MIQVERDFNGSDAVLEAQRLTTHNSGERREPLLTIKEELLAAECATLLFDRQVARRHPEIRLPHENRARRIAAVERVEKIAHSGSRPNVAALEFGKAQLTAIDHVDELANANVYLRHFR